MSKTLYIEANSGISGDMFVAALLSLGADRKALDKALNSLPVSGFEIKISDVFKSGIKACDFDVILDKEHENHDHDMEYLHGHGHTHTHDGVTHHHHEHSTPSGIKHIISHADMTASAKSIAYKILDIIAQAESEAHGIPLEEVHFHEVGAVDSIVDIVSAAVLIDDIDPDEVIIPSLTEGSGTIRCQHGILSVPVPAVANIARAHSLDLKLSQVQGELVTPTGAAIAAAIRTSTKLPKSFNINSLGIGAGKREYEVPSMLRIMDITSSAGAEEDYVIKLETDIDDCPGEELGYVMELLYNEGAREVHFVPIFMKKDRPGYEITVICTEDKRESLERILFKNTTTIGIRRCRMERTILKRYEDVLTTEYGPVKMKTVVLPDGSVRRYPEYESLREISLQTGIALPDLRAKINGCF
ncbi:MAG: nickel pincer cofactor biosynthesis protein LarC [Saccharofermentans sp.]|nr:nickel pincer cofactor biosynthesis protein LarC [Saccharofermentans sp.]